MHHSNKIKRTNLHNGFVSTIQLDGNSFETMVFCNGDWTERAGSRTSSKEHALQAHDKFVEQFKNKIFIKSVSED